MLRRPRITAQRGYRHRQRRVVWDESLVMSGVKIGDGAIIATRAVVAKDVPPYAIVAGNPAKIVKMRFPEKTIQRLLQIAWWNWDRAKIQRNLSHLCHNNIDPLERAL